MTIHIGVACLCVYCYIYDIGFTTKVRPLPSENERVIAMRLAICKNRDKRSIKELRSINKFLPYCGAGNVREHD
jgi:DNA repair photolyase